MGKVDLIIKKYEGMLADMSKQRDEMKDFALEVAKENDKLTGLIKEVKHTLKYFKRALAGRQTENLYKKVKQSELKNETEIMQSIIRNVVRQRTSRSGLHKVVRRYLAEKGIVFGEELNLEDFPEETFQAFIHNSHVDPGFALSVISSMLVVLMDEKEES